LGRGGGRPRISCGPLPFVLCFPRNSDVEISFFFSHALLFPPCGPTSTIYAKSFWCSCVISTEDFYQLNFLFHCLRMIFFPSFGDPPSSSPCLLWGPFLPLSELQYHYFWSFPLFPPIGRQVCTVLRPRVDPFVISFPFSPSSPFQATFPAEACLCIKPATPPWRSSPLTRSVPKFSSFPSGNVSLPLCVREKFRMQFLRFAYRTLFPAVTFFQIFLISPPFFPRSRFFPFSFLKRRGCFLFFPECSLANISPR